MCEYETIIYWSNEDETLIAEAPELQNDRIFQ